MQHTMKSAVLAKKLREKLASLSKERVDATKAYDRDLAKWKKEVADFLTDEVAKRVMTLTLSDFGRGYYEHSLPSRIFKDMPKKPVMKDFDKLRAKVRKGLNYLAIVAPKEVHVSEHMLEAWGLHEEEETED